MMSGTPQPRGLVSVAPDNSMKVLNIWGPAAIRWSIAIAVGAAVIAVLTLSAVAQSVSPTSPGDPRSDDEEVFVSLEAAKDATCGVTAANTIRCWGNNWFAPLRAEGFTEVAVGDQAVCGIRLDGTLQCWGNEFFSWSRGPFGGPFHDPVAPSTPVFPTETDGTAILYSQIDSLHQHICGIRSSNGTVVCWGLDDQGQTSRTPTSDAFSQISAGVRHTCGILGSGASAGEVRCWGRSQESFVPSEHADATFKAVEAGYNFTCGLLGTGTDDGKAVCWGDPLSATVSETPPNERFLKIEAGVNHACGIRVDGTMFCWGSDVRIDGLQGDHGQADVPDEFSDLIFSDIGAGQFHTCGLVSGGNGRTAGEVVCWGAETEYRLDQHFVELLVDGGRATAPGYEYPQLADDPRVDTGSHHNCALTEAGDIACWGGSTGRPTLATGPYMSLAVGADHTCGVRDTGHVQCWGRNDFLQSSGFFIFSSPTLISDTARVEDLTTRYTFESVSLNDYHSCGILDGRTAGQTQGQVLCWGNDRNGQSTPPLGQTFAKISAGRATGADCSTGRTVRLKIV